MQEWERRVIGSGVHAERLMQEAVEGMLREIRKRTAPSTPVLVLAGKGNNGNDALWTGRELELAGHPVHYVLSHPAADRTPSDAKRIHEALIRAHVWPCGLPSAGRSRGWLILDGLLGLGSKGAARGAPAEILKAVAAWRKPMDTGVAVDFPSGLDADSGLAEGEAFRADWTLCLGAVKRGCLADSARPWTGTVLGLPLDSLGASDEGTEGFTDRRAAFALMQGWNAGIHKRRRGTLVLWAGSEAYAGAAALCSRAAVHAGAGLVRLVTSPEVIARLGMETPEVIVEAWKGTGLPEVFAGASAVVAGPGLEKGAATAARLAELLDGVKVPSVLDAEALNMVAVDGALQRKLGSWHVLTPHTGEMARLLGHEVADRHAAVREWSETNEGVLVLKGPNTLVGGKRRLVSSNGSGNPGMGTGGMGDVLSGIIGALLAQGYAPADAARLGVFWHGAAADRVAAVLGGRGVTPTRVIAELGAAWKWMSEGD
jgi:NAD(P)H-hydrate epimerase